jgi:murein DD-endopeptidase MepM/ murein hydrolase activator NlpD
LRIILGVIGVVLFGAVAVAASGSPAGRLPTLASPMVAPRYTPIPGPQTTQPPETGERLARTDGWVAGLFSMPIEGGEIPEDPELLPGAPRDYRAGIHEGIDFPAPLGTPVLAAASGTVTRIDASFVDWTREQQDAALDEALTLGYTPAATLDLIRGRQIWIDHGRGIVTRYAHLSAVGPFSVGTRVEAGAQIGEVGSSGYPQGGPHLHFEVRIGESFYGDGLSGDALVRAVARLFR